jgi:FAD/FMN-containing dehydrogenase
VRSPSGANVRATTTAPRLSSRLTRRELVARGAGAAALLAFGPGFRFAAPDPRLRTLAKTFRGQIVAPGQPLYDRLRIPFNANFDGVRPLAVVRPVDAAYVGSVVRWAAANKVPFVARSGGHSYGGYSTTRGVVVDLAQLSGVHVVAGRAVLGPGARLGLVYNGLAAHGLAIPAGTCPSVGIGGHALGGGFGLASRAWGLASDNLVSARVVTAGGAVLTADAHRHSDLFWACRGGGGGNFGIVTQLVFRTHAVGSGSYFVASWPWAQVEEVVAGYLAWAPQAPDALGCVCRLATGPSGPSVQVFGQFLGTESELRSLLAGLQPAAARLVTGTAAWLDLVRRWAGCLGHTLPGCSVPGNQAFAGSSSYVGRLPTQSQLGLFRQAVEARGTQGGALLMDAYGGAVNRVAPTATAFPHRRALASVQYFASGPLQSTRAWIESARTMLAPAMTGEAYVNYIDPLLTGWQRAYYGANLPRLVHVKRRYDPHNLFHFPQSIPTRLP